MRAFALFVALLVAGACLAQAEDQTCTSPDLASPSTPTWLSGEWTTRNRNGESHQYWTGPLNGVLIGHEVITIAGATSFAFLRIAPGMHGLSLFVSLNGSEPFELSAVEICNSQVVFEGHAKRYPHRIVYRRGPSTVSRAAQPLQHDERQFYALWPAQAPLPL